MFIEKKRKEENRKGLLSIMTLISIYLLQSFLISKDLERQFKIKISEKRLRFENILASFLNKKKKRSIFK